MQESTSRAGSTSHVPPGQRIGSYRLIRPLGTGGMSSVYHAVHEETGHEVALKILTRSLARNSTLLQRFLREARSAEDLQHANIVSIYDRGVDQGRHYLVLELVPGGDFHDHVQRHGPLEIGEAIAIVRDVARGLNYAAGRGLIHRDIKPSNILRTPTGAAKIIDLGLALQSQFEDERVTREGTTVGTVDYMAPEQARDSRATSVQSDIYSLGCTLYYLLTGVPPFPGGDITEKLTRHARSPAPEIRDLRPDVPAQVASILLRMMAKRVEDRFAGYDELIEALDTVPLDAVTRAPAIPLAPLAAEVRASAEADSEVDSGPRRRLPLAEGVEAAAFELEPLPEPLAMESLADLAGEAPRVMMPTAWRRGSSAGSPPLISRSGRSGDPTEPDHAEPDHAEAADPALRPGGASPAWIIPTVLFGVAFVLVVIATHQLLSWSSMPGTIDEESAEAPFPAENLPTFRHSAPSSIAARGPTVSPSDPPDRGIRRQPLADAVRGGPAPEPPDDEPVPGAADLDAGPVGSRAKLPEWARTPIADRVDGAFVVVRRVVEAADPTIKATLGSAVESVIGGTVEVADEGPFSADELRIAGESRLIRPRPGFRPIVRIEAARTEAARQRSAVISLDRKHVTIQGIDWVVDVRDLSSRHTALFGCSGTTLTLRDCTITILNPMNSPFAVVRTEPSISSSASAATAPPRPTRIRLENTLVRGWFSSAVDIAGTPTELAMYRTTIVRSAQSPGGRAGALILVQGRGTRSSHRFDLVETILAGPGPIIERVEEAASPRLNPLVIRAYGSVVGRWRGPGIASVISSAGSAGAAAQLVDYAGDRNVYAGWKGFLASGNEPTILVGGLEEIRSTWNGTEAQSQEILATWAPRGEPALATAEDFRPFLSEAPAFLGEVARPRSGLIEKTIGRYPDPTVPEPVLGSLGPGRPPSPNPAGRRLNGPRIARADDTAGPRASGIPPAPAVAPGGVLELAMNTADPRWHGDLGAFLRDRLPPEVKAARVRVDGSGVHPFTPVRLPAGLHLEIRVEAAGAEPPSWSSDPQATGPALIDLRGGALVLDRMNLAHDPSSPLESLIAVEDTHLVLTRCRLTVPPGAAGAGGRLIVFRAAGTLPRPDDAVAPVFLSGVDRPVCRVIDSTLIAHGPAFRAELGRGLVAFSQSAVASGDAAFELLPTRVARSRFHVDLVLDQSTVVAGRAILSLGPWPGLPYGPDRPWLVTSRNSAFLALSDRRPRETVMLRSDADALARGTLVWQATLDALDVDQLVAVGGGAPVERLNRLSEVAAQWVHFWGDTHVARLITAPRGNGAVPSVRLLTPPRPGYVQPSDLILDPGFRPGPAGLNVGADLSRQGISPRPGRPGPRRT